MALLKCPEYIVFSIYFFRGWVYMLSFALLVFLLVKQLRNSEKALWKPIYSLSISMIALTTLQYLNYTKNESIAPAISRLWLEIFAILFCVIVFFHIRQRRTEPKDTKPKIHKTEQEWPPAIED